MTTDPMRRLVVRHTIGPYAGIRQIIGLVGLAGDLPDLLAPIPFWPDGRLAKAMRLKSTDAYVLYQEIPATGLLEAAGA